MKRFICIALTLLMLLSLCACGGAKEEATFRVGFGRTEITPKGTSVQLWGYGEKDDQRACQGVLDPLYFTCVAVSDTQDNTVLICTTDQLGTAAQTVDKLRNMVNEEYGVPKENLVVSATHTHSSVPDGKIVNYVDLCMKAIRDAMADRATATIKAGSIRPEGMNFVRHYWLEDGTVAGDNFGTNSRKVKHTTEADNELQLIHFLREGDKKNVVMMNWQAHPKLASTNEFPSGKASRNLASADFIGYVRMHIENSTDNLLAYYSGASGNLNPTGQLADENKLQRVNDYGKKLGEYVQQGLEGLQEVQPGLVGAVRKYHEAEGRSGSGLKLEISALHIGSLGFATTPFETFDTNGMEIKDDSPFETTFVLTCASGKYGYIPSSYVWDYPNDALDRPYEEMSCEYARGTAENVAADLVSMLKGLNN